MLPAATTSPNGAPEITAETVTIRSRSLKGTALALKSRALLYAASMLHNPSQDADKWKAALPVSDVRHRKPGWQTRRLWDAYVPDDRAYRVSGSLVRIRQEAHQ